MSTTTATRPRPGPQPRRRASAPAPAHAPRRRGEPADAEPTYVTHGGAIAIAVPERTPAVRPRPTRPQPRPDLKVVRPDQRRRRRVVTPVIGVLLTAGIFVLLLAVAIAHTLLVSGQVHLDHVDDQVTVEQARYQQLREQLAEAEAPDKIVAAARAQGMVSPPDVVYLQPDTAELPSTTPTDDAATEDSASMADKDWSTVKPLLEAPAP